MQQEISLRLFEGVPINPRYHLLELSHMMNEAALANHFVAALNAAMNVLLKRCLTDIQGSFVISRGTGFSTFSLFYEFKNKPYFWGGGDCVAKTIRFVENPELPHESVKSAAPLLLEFFSAMGWDVGLEKA